MRNILTVVILCIRFVSLHGQDACTVFNFEEDNFNVVFENDEECEGQWQREAYDDIELAPPEHATHYITATTGTACAGTVQNFLLANGAIIEIVFYIEVPEGESVDEFACIELRERNDNNVIIERCIYTTEFENGWHTDIIEMIEIVPVENGYMHLRGQPTEGWKFKIDSLRFVESRVLLEECHIYQLEDAESSQESESEETQETESDETQETESEDTQETESDETQETESEETQETESDETQETESEDTQETESDETQETESDETQETESDETQETESDETQETEESQENSSEETDDGLSAWIIAAIVVGCVLAIIAVAAASFLIGRHRAEKKPMMPYPYGEEIEEIPRFPEPRQSIVPRVKTISSVNAEEIVDIPGSRIIALPRAKAIGSGNSSTLQSNPSYNGEPHIYKLEIHNHFGR